MSTRTVITREQAITTAMRVRGMLDEPQIGFLYDLAQQAPDGAAAEVGIWRGRSFVGWALGRWGRGPLIAIDWWYQGQDTMERREGQAQPGLSPAQIGAQRRADFECTLDALGMAREVRIISVLSWEAAAQIGEPLAFCFIDACHDEEAVARDIAAYTPTIMPGGIIAYHDYGTRKCPGVKRQVDDWQAGARWEPLGLVGSTVAYRRCDDGPET